MHSIIHSICFLIATTVFQPHVKNLDLPNKDKVAVVVDKGTFKLNGKPVDKAWSYKHFSKALGKPSTDDDATDAKECFHSKGIVMWKDDAGKIVDQFLVQYAYDPEESWYQSSVFFSGSVVIDGLTISKRTRPSELQSKLPNYNWEKNSMGWYEGRYMNIFMYFAYDESMENLLWIDFGTY